MEHDPEIHCEMRESVNDTSWLEQMQKMHKPILSSCFFPDFWKGSSSTRPAKTTTCCFDDLTKDLPCIWTRKKQKQQRQVVTFTRVVALQKPRPSLPLSQYFGTVRL